MKYAKPLGVEHLFVFKMLHKHAIAATLIVGCLIS